MSEEQEPVAWMVYTLDGTSVCVTDNPADFTDQHEAFPLYTTPPDDTTRDWSLLEATQESLREHMAIIQKDTALLRQALGALEEFDRPGDETLDEWLGRSVITAIRTRLGDPA